MRCGCPECGTYMIQSEGMRLGCVCPNCGTRCTDCLGTNTVISREALKELKGREWFQWEKTERHTGGGQAPARGDFLFNYF